MNEGHIWTDGLLSDDDMTDSWMKVMDGLCPIKKSLDNEKKFMTS